MDNSNNSNNKCRNCNKNIPNSIVIKGKKKRLNNRVFCLDCSPYKSHNTKYDITKSSKWEYNKLTKEKRLEYNAYYHFKGFERKNDLIIMSGGKCSKCGYSKCSQALEFHHRNPEEKEFCLTASRIKNMKWKKVIEEWKKCDLLCANCHREIEHELNRNGKYASILKNIKRDIQKISPKKKVFKVCSNPTCNKKHEHDKYCSNKCRGIDKRKVERPSKEQLAEDMKTMTWVAMGKKYGNVSDNAVRKWAKGYNLITT